MSVGVGGGLDFMPAMCEPSRTTAAAAEIETAYFAAHILFCLTKRRALHFSLVGMRCWYKYNAADAA